MQWLQQKAHELRLPVLVQHVMADSLVPLAAMHPIYQHLGVAKSRIKCWSTRARTTRSTTSPSAIASLATWRAGSRASRSDVNRSRLVAAEGQ